MRSSLRPRLSLAASLLALGCTCKSPELAMGPRPEGVRCDRDEQCETGLCDALPGADKLCLRGCLPECRQNEVCTTLAPGRHGCVPDRAGLCKTCWRDSDCPYRADRCLQLGEERFCGRDCAFDGECPSGFRCLKATTPEGEEVASQCQPQSGTCQCTIYSAGQSLPCEQKNAFGLCQGAITCQPPLGYSSCSARVPAPESCNGVDDDCDTLTDEDLGELSCGVGECRRTVAACANGQAQLCAPGDAGVEACDERDNDCDGTVDNGFDKSSLQHCGGCFAPCAPPHSVPACDGGACTILSCLGAWRDCDRQVPDGCEVDSASDKRNCGSCGNLCQFDHADPFCDGSVCRFTCLPNYWDLDQLPSNGCEYSCTKMSAFDLPDDSTADTNCDGIDGDVSKAFFVDCASGNDANPGTQKQPLRTIARALSLASPSGRDQVLVSGTCSESVTLKEGVGLFGGYSPSFGRSLATPATLQQSVGGGAAVVGQNISQPTYLDALVVVAAAGSAASPSSIAVQLSNASGVQISNCELRAGAGASGEVGQPGAPGASGAPGLAGQPGVDNGSNGGAGGAGGPGACGNGAAGGTGGFDEENGQPGFPSLAGAGGLGGVYQMCTTCSSCADPRGVREGGPGTQGSNGGPGSSGSGGDGSGSVVSGAFLPSAGASGGTGSPGTPGTGGGGGGGGAAACCAKVAGICGCAGGSCFSDRGGGGGGGGAPGCGGGGGRGGGGGGASLGILLINSSPAIRNSRIQTQAGGGGGAGGAGASGAGGAPGGQGGSNADDAAAGGPGGSGGAGGNGGPGGGGGGGPSVGIYRAGSSAPATTALTFVLGAGGAGGAGGPGASGGAAGISQDVYP